MFCTLPQNYFGPEAKKKPHHINAMRLFKLLPDNILFEYGPASIFIP